MLTSEGIPYEPYERFDVTFQDSRVTEYGRIARNNAVWEEEYQVFTLTADVEEGNTPRGNLAGL